MRIEGYKSIQQFIQDYNSGVVKKCEPLTGKNNQPSDKKPEQRDTFRKLLDEELKKEKDNLTKTK